jgi:glycolate oxidase
MGIQDVKETLKSCRFCFMCRHACPTFLATKLDSHTPRGYALLLSQIDEGYRTWTKETAERFYQCSQCGLCREDCEYHWQEDELVRNAREEIINTAFLPEQVKTIAASIIQTGTPYPVEETAANIPIKVGKKNVDLLYFAGCSTRQNHPVILESLKTIFQIAGIEWTMLDDEGCCGVSLYELGYPEEAQDTAGKLAAKISEVNPNVLVTGCPHCFRGFKTFYPQWEARLSAEVQIFHTSQYLQMLVADEKLILDQGNREVSAVCYHDPCQLGRNMGEYDAPRSLIQSATGQAPLELFHNKALAECCGAGSVMFLTDPDIAAKVAKKRVERVDETQAEIVITACQNCKMNLVSAQDEAEKQVMDITELIASKLKAY